MRTSAPTVATNDIPTRQLELDTLSLLRARKRSYTSAKWIFGLTVALGILLPTLNVLLAPTFPELKPFVALVALLVLILDVAYLDRSQRAFIIRGAKLQEEVDVRVLRMPWNDFLVGAKVEPEDVQAASAKPLSKKLEGQLRNWYEPCVGEVPIQFGRLICQRTNITYDARLRQSYGRLLLWSTVGLGVLLLFWAVAKNLTSSQLLLTLAVPYTPLLTWAVRDYRRQADTTQALSNLNAEFRKLWAKALAGMTDAELEARSRELQDAIYQRRVSNPLVFDWVYACLRNKNEDAAHYAAAGLVAEAKSSLVKRGGA